MRYVWDKGKGRWVPAGGPPRKGPSGKAGWPMRSLALGVHPSQAGEAAERNRRHGVNVAYDEYGRAVIPDAGTRKKLMRLEGMHDKDAFC